MALCLVGAIFVCVSEMSVDFTVKGRLVLAILRAVLFCGDWILVSGIDFLQVLRFDARCAQSSYQSCASTAA
jgi:hypothetical protein